MVWKNHAALVAENMRLRQIVREQQDRYRRLEAELVALKKAVFLPWHGFIS